MALISFYTSIVGNEHFYINTNNEKMSVVSIDGVKYYCLSNEEIKVEFAFEDLQNIKNAKFYKCDSIVRIEVLETRDKQ